MVRTADRVVRSPRIAARRREVRAEQIRRRRRIVIAVVLIAALGYGAWTLVRSSVFSLQKIDVVGSTVLDDQTIIEASGLHIGQNALKIDFHDVVARIRALPGIADVRVERNGSLGIRISITERTASIEVRAGESVWYLDRSGILIDAAHRGTRALPVIKLSASASFTSLSEEELSGVLAVWKQMSVGLRRSVASFSFREDGTMTFRLGSTLVVFGTTENIAAKLQAITLVRARVAADHRRLIQLDVQAPSRPAARIA